MIILLVSTQRFNYLDMEPVFLKFKLASARTVARGFGVEAVAGKGMNIS
jgi:hypothetical protein